MELPVDVQMNLFESMRVSRLSGTVEEMLSDDAADKSASAIMLTMVTDVVGFFLFLGFAALALSMLPRAL